MKFKIMFMALIMLTLIGLTCVSAADNNHEDMAILSHKSEDSLLSVNNDAGTFTELKNTINSGDNVFKLEKDYKFNPKKDNKEAFRKDCIQISRSNYVVDVKDTLSMDQIK